jgi:tRNA threonylcarbamoyladenosine biosynthesis protein TsaE
MESRSVLLADAAATQALGQELAGLWLDRQRAINGMYRPAPILLLRGGLGAGKTCLVQGIALGLGINEPVSSPTFALAQHYRGFRDGRSTALVHLDLYRLDTPAAADEFFAEEEEESLAMNALMAVEWSERLTFLPDGAWLIDLELLRADQPEAGRKLSIEFSALNC